MVLGMKGVYTLMSDLLDISRIYQVGGGTS
jgi:hypothetical protein